MCSSNNLKKYVTNPGMDNNLARGQDGTTVVRSWPKVFELAENIPVAKQPFK
jgi:hypothetical protein